MKDGWYYLNTTNNATDYNWFCFDANGVMRTGWVPDKNDPSVWYYTGESKGSSEGGLVKGWATDPRDGKRYYMDPSTGIMRYGWQLISDVWYYFGEPQYSNASHPYGAMYVNEKTPDGYYVGSNGAWGTDHSDGNSDTPDPAPKTYYTVTFDMQGHGTQIAPITNVLSGSKIAEPAAPAAEGFIFAGWYKEAACANAWSFDTDKVTNNTTIYAKWTTTLTPVDAPTAATGLIYNGMVQTGVAEATGYTVTNGKAKGADTYSATAALAAGYKWSDGTTADKQISWNIAKAALTATADDKYVIVHNAAPAYTVTYTGWVNDESIGTVTPETAAVLACQYTTASPEGDYDITFTTEPAFANYTVTAVAGKLTATTGAPKDTVTFDLNGIEGTAPTDQFIDKGGTVNKPEDPTDAVHVHTFAGWYKTKDATTGALSDPWNFDTDTVTDTLKLYAQWTRTLGSIYGTNENVPRSDNDTAPDKAWENGDGGKAFIAYSTGNAVLYLTGTKTLSCGKTELFTKIGDDYVLDYSSNSIFYGKYTLHMTEGIFTSVTYNGAGTDYVELSGTYAAPKGLLKASGTSSDPVNDAPMSETEVSEPAAEVFEPEFEPEKFEEAKPEELIEPAEAVAEKPIEDTEPDTPETMD